MCNLLNLCFSACCHYSCFCVCLGLLKIIYSLYFIDRVLTNFHSIIISDDHPYAVTVSGHQQIGVCIM